MNNYSQVECFQKPLSPKLYTQGWPELQGRKIQRPVNLRNAEVLLTDIMDDVDLLLHDLEDPKRQSNENDLIAAAPESVDLLRADSSLLKEILSK